MIVLDTNQLDYLQSPHGPLFVLLETIAGQSAHGLALPEMVLAEHLAHHRHEVEMQIKVARDAVRSLSELDARPRPVFSAPDPDQSVRTRGATLGGFFTVLRTPDGAEHEGMMREANRRRPADLEWNKKGAGGRDVVVWLTVLAAMKELDEGEQLLFVSSDGDFIDKQGELHSELRDEMVARGLDPTRLRMCRDVGRLLKLYAEKAEPPADLDRLLNLAARERSLALSVGADAAKELSQRLGDALGIVAVTLIRSPELTLRGRGRTEAYRMGDNTWISAQCTWNGMVDFAVIAATAEHSTRVPVSPAECTVRGSVLIRVGPDCPDGEIAMVSREQLRMEGAVYTAL